MEEFVKRWWAIEVLPPKTKDKILKDLTDLIAEGVRKDRARGEKIEEIIDG